MEHNESCAKRKVHSTKWIHKKFREILYEQLNSTLERSRTKEANTPKRRRGQEIIELRAEINEIGTKRTIQRANEAKLVL